MLGVNPKNISKNLGLTYGGHFGMIFGMADDKRSAERQRSPDQIGDEALVKAHQCGDDSALTNLIKRYEAPLRRYVAFRSWVKEPSFIDDILQTICLIILNSLRKEEFTPKGVGSFKAWAYRICDNICLDENQKVRRRESLLSQRYPDEFPGELDEVKPEPATDPLVFEEQRTQLHRALDKLKQQERRLFELRRQGLSYKQIKETPDFRRFSLGRLRLKYYEIMEKLKKLLTKE